MATTANRVAVYYQTQYSAGTYVSPLPLLGLVTHLFLAAFHLNYGSIGADVVHLNNDPPGDALYDQMWGELAGMQANGTKVLGMVGGAAPGTYYCLSDERFDAYYPALRDALRAHDLDGIDLDVEETLSPAAATRLIAALKADFRERAGGFLVTLAPVASALRGEGNLSGFSYVDLEAAVGDAIDWYNAQFYSGFAWFDSAADYEAVIEYMGISPARVSATVLTSADDGYGYVDTAEVVGTVRELRAKYGAEFGGVSGWEYFNALPDSSRPWEWAAEMKKAMEGRQGATAAEGQRAKTRVRPPAGQDRNASLVESQRPRAHPRMFERPAN